MNIDRSLTVCAALTLCSWTLAPNATARTSTCAPSAATCAPSAAACASEAEASKPSWWDSAGDDKTAEAAEKHLIAASAKVVGLRLDTPEKKNVGEIGDLLIDPKSGEVRYAVLEVGGFLGIGEDKRVVPWALVEIVRSTDDPEKLVARTTLTEAQVESAPKCKGGQVFDAELDRSIEKSFGKSDAWAYAGDGNPTFAWLGQMKGAMVIGPDSKEVGRVREVVLAPQNGCAAYVVLNASERAGGEHIAIPWTRVRFTHDRNDQVAATTDVDNARLQSAPQFDEKDEKRMSSTAWLKDLSDYYACDPFWKTSRFASARKPAAPVVE